MEESIPDQACASLSVKESEFHMRIERATSADIPELGDLLSVLFSQEVEFTPDAAAQRRGLARIIDDAEIGSVLVARQDGQLVGMVTLLFTVSTALGERAAWLEDMIVSPASRGKGIGTTLLCAAISFARAQSCQRITLLTDQKNEAAQRFYAKQGFAVSSMVPMRLSLA